MLQETERDALWCCATMRLIDVAIHEIRKYVDIAANRKWLFCPVEIKTGSRCAPGPSKMFHKHLVAMSFT
jgi:hypothetical protein